MVRRSDMGPSIIFCVLLFLQAANAENVLISCSLGEGSHYFVGKTIGKYLAKKGHSVTALISNAYAHRAENPEDKELNFLIFNHSVPPEDVLERHRAYSKMALVPVGPSLIYQLIMSQRQGSINDCDDLFFKNPLVMERIENGNFSAVVFDQIWPCSLLLAMKFDAIAVMSNPMSVVAMLSTLTKNPVDLAYTPETMTQFKHPMSFFQRATNVIVNQALWLLIRFFSLPFDEFRHHHQIRPDLTGSVMDMLATYPDLYLTNMDFAVEYPAPLYPNVIPIGGITARPPSPLPEDLEAVMEASGDDGVIVFTLGTYFNQVRPDWLRVFADAFRRVPQTIIWQFKGDPPFEIPSNVKMMPWVPQNDLLGHPKTRLFVFHGGNNGFYETQYHGVPVVLVPLTGDAVDSAIRVVDRGFGVVVDKTIVNADLLHTAISTVLGNESYRRAARRQSELLHSRAMHPGDKAAFWVEHVMKYGGAYMKNPALDLNFVQRNLIDVFLFLSAVLLLISLVVFYICRCCLRSCMRLCFNSKEKRE